MPPSDWDPALYTTFERERTRPAEDLLRRVDLARPASIVDLGCGPGNSTELLARRFPNADLTGVDTSAAMLSSARVRLPDVRFVEADVAAYRPEEPPDLLFANAVLQWLPAHRALLPHLLGLLAPDGVLAVQVPDNLEEPSHRLMREVAEEQPWRSRIGSAASPRTRDVLPPDDYYDLLSPTAEVDVWRTTYHHPMPSPRAIVDWLRATGLRPFLDPLTPDEQAAFLERYTAAVDAAYPARRDGRRLLAFPRLFVVARRNDPAT